LNEVLSQPIGAQLDFPPGRCQARFDAGHPQFLIEVGRFLGLGARTIEVSADTVEQLADRIRSRLGGEQI
jgi:hypothetical protein